MFSPRILCATVLAAFTIQAANAGTALTLGSAAGYDVFVLGAYGTSGGTDIQGSVAVGGNFTSIGSLSINETPGSATPSVAGLVVGGGLSLAAGQFDNSTTGRACVGSNVISSGYFYFQQNFNYVGTLNSSNIVVGGGATMIGAILWPRRYSVIPEFIRDARPETLPVRDNKVSDPLYEFR